MVSVIATQGLLKLTLRMVPNLVLSKYILIGTSQAMDQWGFSELWQSCRPPFPVLVRGVRWHHQ